MRVLIAALLLMTALAGCAEGTEPVDASSGTDESHEGTNATIEDTVSVNNTAPVAFLGVEGFDIENGTFNTTLTALNFTIDGSDADGDNLTWELTQNGTVIASGDSLPSVANATLAAGNHTFVLTVSDGNLTGNATLLAIIEAAGDGVDPNAPVDMGPFIFDPVTGHCHYKSFTDVGGLGQFYNFDFWLWKEDNGVPGLQVGNTFPVGPAEDQGFRMDEWEICEDGDLIVF